MVKLERLDHLVLTVASIESTCDFYRRALGMEIQNFGEGRTALAFGSQKINLHERGKELEPKAQVPTPGSADLCFLTQTPLADVMDHLSHCGVRIIEGPIARTGATGPILSIYFRDPDGNLGSVANHGNKARLDHQAAGACLCRDAKECFDEAVLCPQIARRCDGNLAFA